MFLILLSFLFNTSQAHPDPNETKKRLIAEIEKAPQNAKLHLALANILWQQNQISKALEYLQKAETMPNPPSAIWLLRGNILIGQNKSKEAQTSLEIFLQKEPRSPKGARSLGLLLLKNAAFTIRARPFDPSREKRPSPTTLSRCSTSSRLPQEKRAYPCTTTRSMVCLFRSIPY